jgi:hypothetical protein
MIADAVKHLVHTGISAWLLHRRLDGYGDQRLWRTIARTSAAATGMGLLTFGIALLVDAALPAGLIGYAVAVALAGGAGIASFSLLATGLGLDEWRWVRGLLRQRIGL